MANETLTPPVLDDAPTLTPDVATVLDVDLTREPACGWGKGSCDRPARWQHSWRHADDGGHPGMILVCSQHHAYTRMLFSTSDRATCGGDCLAELDVAWRRL
ncbi:hypothetical protein ACFCZ3_20030 [Cellulosimicrobium cellulans]|uniref:hypothetical protein n=1 Tax=Cellulosimicrobium cellulans TaxID=1710 RepID=UPI0035D96A60